jgi:hypothetical protein
MPSRSGNDWAIDVAELKGYPTPLNQLVLRRLFVPARRPAVFLAAVLVGVFFAAAFCGAAFDGAAVFGAAALGVAVLGSVVCVGTDVSFAGVGWLAWLGD